MTTHLPVTVERLRAEHLEDLRRIATDPRAFVQPIRRKLYVRLGLMAPSEPPRQPTERKGKYPARAHVLTVLGQRVIA